MTAYDGIRKIISGRREMVKEKITLWIESGLKSKFLATSSKHKRTYTDAFVLGLYYFIGQEDPVYCLQAEIQQKSQELDELRERMVRLQLTSQGQKDLDIFSSDEENDRAWRDELFETDYPVLKKTWGSADFYTARLMERYEFKNKSEAREFFRPRMKKKLEAPEHDVHD